MAVAGPTEPASVHRDIADGLAGAEFVRLLARPTGDALAATGLLAGTLDGPFHARVTEDPVESIEGETTVVLGEEVAIADLSIAGERPASSVAFEVARDLGSDPDPVLALAGAFAANRGALSEAAASAFEIARENEAIERRPGIGVPGELADGLAHTTLVHGAFSGDREAATGVLDELAIAPDASPTALEETEGRRLASWLALSGAGNENTPREVTDAIERALRPHVLTRSGDPFETVEGYGDVLAALAESAPGVGLGVVLGDTLGTARSAWREHAANVHTGFEEARPLDTTAEALSVARVPESTPLSAAARLLFAFETDMTTIVVTDGAAAAVGSGDEPLRAVLDGAASTLEGTSRGDDRRATARFSGTAEAFATAVAEEANAMERHAASNANASPSEERP